MNLPAPEPLLPLALPVALDGRDGINRGRGAYRQIAADTDLDAVRLWLAEYVHSPHTLRSYRKEAVRLLICGFSRRPPPTGPTRRLFDGPLAERSRRQALGILSGLFNYLVAAGNPLALRRSRSATTTRKRRIERYLDHALWQVVLDSVEAWLRDTPRERQHYERSRWLIRLLYHTALRASEAAHAKAADFFQRRGRWWLHVTGKGGTPGEVPVSPTLMAEFARYRTFFGLLPMPAPDEMTPAVMSIAGDTGRHLTPAAIYLIAKAVFRRAANTLEPADPAGAATLRRASTHWLRHSAASHQADAGTDIRFIQKNLRHASIETTGLYLHAEDDRRHEHTVGEQCNGQSCASALPQ
ncbi:hypothetical protein DFQ30_002230 [Apophysomyces sp. BC1015]|nr:hypothetical protein DFQ30_002230 [Apophysomyces sp. BC1015]